MLLPAHFHWYDCTAAWLTRDEHRPGLPVVALLNKQSLTEEYRLALVPSQIPAASNTLSTSIASSSTTKDAKGQALVRKEACRVCADGQFLYLLYEVIRSGERADAVPESAMYVLPLSSLPPPFPLCCILRLVMFPRQSSKRLCILSS